MPARCRANVRRTRTSHDSRAGIAQPIWGRPHARSKVRGSSRKAFRDMASRGAWRARPNWAFVARIRRSTRPVAKNLPTRASNSSRAPRRRPPHLTCSPPRPRLQAALQRTAEHLRACFTHFEGFFGGKMRKTRPKARGPAAQPCGTASCGTASPGPRRSWQ